MPRWKMVSREAITLGQKVSYKKNQKKNKGKQVVKENVNEKTIKENKQSKQIKTESGLISENKMEEKKVNDNKKKKKARKSKGKKKNAAKQENGEENGVLVMEEVAEESDGNEMDVETRMLKFIMTVGSGTFFFSFLFLSYFISVQCMRFRSFTMVSSLKLFILLFIFSMMAIAFHVYNML